MISRGPFQLQPLCDSVKCYYLDPKLKGGLEALFYTVSNIKNGCYLPSYQMI